MKYLFFGLLIFYQYGQAIDSTAVFFMPDSSGMPVLQLEAVEVEASRQSLDATEFPASRNRLQTENIRQTAPTMSAELLRQEEGIFVQKTSHGGGSPIIRGLSAGHILLMIDGFRLNNSVYRLGNHAYMNTVDVNSLSRMEVLRGPASARFGSDALGGVVDMHSQALQFSRKSRYSGRLILGAASADASARARAEMSFAAGPWAVNGGLSYRHFGDLRRGSQSAHRQLEKATDGLWQRPTGFANYAADIKLGRRFGDDMQVIAAWQYSRQAEVPRYDKYENENYLQWLYAPRERQLGYIKLIRLTNSGWLQRWDINLAWQRQTEGRKTQTNADAERTEELDRVDTYAITANADTRLGNHELSYGFDFYYDHVHSQRRRLSQETGAEQLPGRFPDNADYISGGAYLRDKWQLSRQLFLHLAGRYAFQQTDFAVAIVNFAENGNYSQRFSALTGSASLYWQTTEAIFFQAALRQGFRAPNLSDLARLGESKGETYEIPNPDLGPERALSAEIGGGFNANGLEISLTLYQTWLSDFIDSAPDSLNGSATIEIDDRIYLLRSKQNLGSAVIYGFEGRLFVPLSGDYYGRGNITYTFGENTTAAEPYSGIPPLHGRLGFGRKDQVYDLELFLRAADWQRRLSADDLLDSRIPDGGSPAWYTVNFRFGIWLSKHLWLNSGVENILDGNYREHRSGVNGPGRNYFAALEYYLP
jgi:hemoglobin/transferrin/lactoferrin receptor protein